MILLPHEQAIVIPAMVGQEMSKQEIDHEMDLMFERSQMADQFLLHGVGFQDYIDLLETQNVNIDSYLDAVEQCLLTF